MPAPHFVRYCSDAITLRYLFIFALTCAAVPVCAAEWEVPRGWRVITQTQSTSGCIGKPMSPLCAAETLVACHLRADERLCLAAGAPPDRALCPPDPDGWFDCRVETVREVSDEEIRQGQHASPPYLPGDVLVALFDNGYPRTDPQCAPNIRTGEQYFSAR
jgi:hypothetical protein